MCGSIYIYICGSIYIYICVWFYIYIYTVGGNFTILHNIQHVIAMTKESISNFFLPTLRLLKAQSLRHCASMTGYHGCHHGCHHGCLWMSMAMASPEHSSISFHHHSRDL